MFTKHLLSSSFIEEQDMSIELEKTTKKLNLSFEREQTKNGVFYTVSKPGVDGIIEMSSPRKNWFEETMSWNVKNYGTLLAIDHDIGIDHDKNMFPLFFELLKELEDVLLIDDEGEWIYFPSDTPIDEEGYDRIRTSEYKKGDVVY